MIRGLRDPRRKADLERIITADRRTLTGRERQRLAAHNAMCTHGMSHTPEYRTWQMMKNRCTNRRDPHYRRYGARGITVCKRWSASFEKFLEDMKFRPSAKHTLERKNNNGPYTKRNCRWATRFEQGQNTSMTKASIILNGERLTFAEASRRLGLKPWTLSNRIRRDGWSRALAIATPLTVRVGT